MRISDWSSDVCSSDLQSDPARAEPGSRSTDSHPTDNRDAPGTQGDPMTRHRFALASFAALATTALLAGCTTGDPDADGSSEDDAFTYALITPGAAGDGGFIDSAIAGARLAEEELGVTEIGRAHV